MIEDEDGEEVEYALPATHVVCDGCKGHGTHLNPSIGQHAYSLEEFNQEYDEEEKEQYFTRGGMYDVQCQECSGRRVVLAINRPAAEITSPEILKKYNAWLSAQEESAYERAFEERWEY